GSASPVERVTSEAILGEYRETLAHRACRLEFGIRENVRIQLLQSAFDFKRDYLIRPFLGSNERRLRLHPYKIKRPRRHPSGLHRRPRLVGFFDRDIGKAFVRLLVE